jgi:Polysaccharide deacetylase
VTPAASTRNSLTFTAHHEIIAGGRFIRVVNYHNTPRSAVDSLREELAIYGNHFDSITLADLDRFYADGAWPSDRPGFVPVFYEGYRNSYDVAGRVCDELGLTGWFPVCTGFIDCPPDEQEMFARSHWIGLVDEEKDGGRLALSWEEVAELSQRHVVYPHTASHDGIVDVVTPADFHREIVEPKQKLDAVTGQSAPAFAWLHGSPWGLSRVHDQALVDTGYRYLFSNTKVHRIA